MKPLNPSDAATELLQNAYDLHIHAAPSPFHRMMDDYALLRAAGEAGMAGILLKSHYEPTAVRAELANQHAGSSAVAYGAVALNWPVGGLNPYAVHNALKRGAKLIFMPTRDAANSLATGDMPGDFFRRDGLTILDGAGKLKGVVSDILDVVKSYGAALATGHLGIRESILLCREGRSRGVRMVLTHPEFSRTKTPAAMQRELAELGVLIEHCWYNLGESECAAAEMAANIRAAGVENCYLSTDRGQSGREAPAEAMKRFIAALLEEGFTKEELQVMLRRVPRAVLGLE